MSEINHNSLFSASPLLSNEVYKLPQTTFTCNPFTLYSTAGAIPTGYEKKYKFLRTDDLFPAQVFYPGH